MQLSTAANAVESGPCPACHSSLECHAGKSFLSVAVDTSKLSGETDEEREARLQSMRDRLSNETVEEREARLQRMRDRQTLLLFVLQFQNDGGPYHTLSVYEASPLSLFAFC